MPRTFQGRGYVLELQYDGGYLALHFFDWVKRLTDGVRPGIFWAFVREHGILSGVTLSAPRECISTPH